MVPWTGYAIWAAGILSLVLGAGNVILWATFPPEANLAQQPGVATAVLWVGGCCLIALGEVVRLLARQDRRNDAQFRPPAAKPPRA